MSRFCILYVDDEPDIREIAMMALQLDSEFDVHTAASGVEALQLLEDPRWRFDVILLDLMMPGMDGQAVMAEIRQTSNYANAPIAFVTAKAAPADTQYLLARGAHGVITKPFDPMTLASDIRAMFAL